LFGYARGLRRLYAEKLDLFLAINATSG